jgi:predicted KAP-like P-loop ATPase
MIFGRRIRSMARKRHTTEEIVAKLRQVDVLLAQGRQVADAVRAIGVFRAVEKALSKKESLSALRGRLITQLREVSTPIVVLIDELDRIEDEEIRSVAQLVRSVLDFPAISYVLAYDPERVMQALGSGASESERRDLGRSYLEKIVQIQIPIPVTFAD